jgi:type 1 glutamine amidotransferase
MNTPLRNLILILIFLSFTNPIQAQSNPKTPASTQEKASILVFTHTKGHRHGSIKKGVSTLRELAEKEGMIITHTEDPLKFNPENLSKYQLVVFLSTTGDVLESAQEQAFQSYIQNGGSFMGIHAATDTEYNWPWYGKLVGAYFESHPEQQTARVEVINQNHPATKDLEVPWIHFDEWYNFKDIREGITVLMMLDESSYEGGKNGSYHPIAWYHEFDGGRSFYTGLGHTEEAFDSPNFRKHLLGGMHYCLGLRQ